MKDNLFLPEWPVVAYALIATALCFTVYRAPSLARYAWGAPGMNTPIGGGHVRQFNENDTMAGRAATGATNVLNSLTPGGAATLLVLSAWIAGAVLGMLLLPAAFGAMSRVSTLNVVFVTLGGLAVAFTMSRLTATIISAGFVLAVLGLLAAVVVAVVLIVAVFLTGGRSGPLAGAWDGISERLTSINEMTDLDKSEFGRGLIKRMQFNGCVISVAAKTVGDMHHAREVCDDTWAAAQTKLVVDAQKREAQALASWQKTEDWMRKTGLGIPIVRIPPNAKNLASTWRGQLACPNSDGHIVYMRLQGQPEQASGVVQVFPDMRSAELRGVETYAAYRVTVTKSGDEVQIKRGEDIAKGINMPDIATRFNYSPGYVPFLVAQNAKPGCKLRMDAAVKITPSPMAPLPRETAANNLGKP